MPTSALSWAVTLLAITIGVAAQVDTNAQHYELFSSKKSSADILQQLDTSGYITSLANNGGVGMDLRVAYKLVRSQQLWRRRDVSKKKGKKEIPQYSLLDCNPLFAAQRKISSWFRMVTFKVALCAHVCQDYPKCTMTTPLMNSTNGSLATLVYCNYTVKVDDSETFQLLAATGRNNSYTTICRNAVDSITPKDNVTVKGEPVEISKGSTIALTRYTTKARPACAAVNIFGSDLWSNWHIQPTSVSILGDLPVNCEGYSTSVIQCGPDLCQIDSKQVLHLSSAVVRPDRLMKLDKVGRTDIKNIKDKCQMASIAYVAIDSMWMLQPRPDNGYVDTTFLERNDSSEGWQIYPFFGTDMYTNRFNGALVDENGLCEGILNNMSTIGNCLRGFKPILCNLSQSSLNCTEGNLFDSVHGIRCLNNTNERCSEEIRGYNGVRGRCSEEIQGYNGVRGRCSEEIRGCNGVRAFQLNREYTACDGYYYAVPALDAPVGLGASHDTYKAAKDMYNTMLGTSQRLGASQRITDSVPDELDTKFTNSKGNYYAIDIGGYWNQTDIEGQLEQAREITVALVQQWSFHDTQATSIATALVLLFVQVLQIPTHWSKEAQNGIINWYTSKLSLSNKSALLNVVAVFVLRFFASAVRVGPTMFPFVLAVKADVGSSIYGGYPQLAYYSINDIKPNGKSYNYARQGAEFGTLGLTTTAIVNTTVQIWAVALVCTICGLAVIIVSVWAAVEEYRSSQVYTDIKGVAKAETQCDKQIDIQLPARTENRPPVLKSKESVSAAHSALDIDNPSNEGTVATPVVTENKKATLRQKKTA